MGSPLKLLYSYLTILILILNFHVSSAIQTGCQSEITQSLKAQQILFVCQNGCVVIEDQLKVSVSLNFQNLSISTCLIFKNIISLSFTPSLTLSHTSFALANTPPCFLQIHTVSIFTIDSLEITEISSEHTDFQFISASAITQLKIPQQFQFIASKQFNMFENLISITSETIQIQALSLTNFSNSISLTSTKSTIINSITFIQNNNITNIKPPTILSLASPQITIDSITLSKCCDDLLLSIDLTYDIFIKITQIPLPVLRYANINQIIYIPYPSQQSNPSNDNNNSTAKITITAELPIASAKATVKINSIQSMNNPTPNSEIQFMNILVSAVSDLQIDTIDVLESDTNIFTTMKIDQIHIHSININPDNSISTKTNAIPSIIPTTSSPSLLEFPLISFNEFVSIVLSAISLSSLTSTSQLIRASIGSDLTVESTKITNCTISNAYLSLSSISSLTILDTSILTTSLIASAPYISLAHVGILTVTSFSFIGSSNNNQISQQQSSSIYSQSAATASFSTFSSPYLIQTNSSTSMYFTSINFDQSEQIMTRRRFLASSREQITLSTISPEFSSSTLGFLQASNFEVLIIEESIFKGGFTVTNGGTITITQNLFRKNEVKLFDCLFESSMSSQFGGAIYGGTLTDLVNVQFINCQSTIGGAIFMSRTSRIEALKAATYSNNTAAISNHNYCTGVENAKVSKVFEFNPTFPDTPLYLRELPLEDVYSVYLGFNYILQISLLIDMKWVTMSSSSSSQINTTQLSQSSMLNLYDFLQIPLFFDASYVSSIDFLYLNVKLSKVSPIIRLNFLENSFDFVFLTNINANCTIGMQAVQVGFMRQSYCEYCEISKASYNANPNSLNPSSECQTCDASLFNQCYANYSSVMPGYYRESYTINSSSILACSIAPGNCLGSYGILNEICSEGHLDKQCLNCDITGSYWNASYAENGIGTCVKCDSISQNTLKLALLLTAILLSLLVIISSNYLSLRNCVYASYLARMKLTYVGGSLLRRQSTSVYIKILLFNFFFVQLSNDMTQVSLANSIQAGSIVQKSPLSYAFFSMNCFLIEVFPEQLSTGLSNLLIYIIAPLCVLGAISIGLGMLILRSKTSLRMAWFILRLSCIYLFLVVIHAYVVEQCLKSFACVDLGGSNPKEFSLIDLRFSCESGSNSSSELSEIQEFSVPIMIVFGVTMPAGILWMLIRSRENLGSISSMFSLGFLYKEYKTRYFFWEFVRIFIRVLSITAKVFLFKYPLIACAIVTLVCAAYYAVLALIKPFNVNSYTRLEQISVAISILNLQIALVFEDKAQMQEENMIAFVKIIYIISQVINVAFIAYLVVVIIVSYAEKQLVKVAGKYLHLRWCIQKFIPYRSGNLRRNLAKLHRLVREIKKSRKTTVIELQQSECTPFKLEDINNNNNSNLDVPFIPIDSENRCIQDTVQDFTIVE